VKGLILVHIPCCISLELELEELETSTLEFSYMLNLMVGFQLGLLYVLWEFTPFSSDVAIS
jgi:hypothetical protein